MFGFLRFPVSGQDELSPGRYDFQLNPSYAAIVDFAISVGGTYDFSGHRAIITNKKYDAEGNLVTLQADIEKTSGPLESKITFQQFFIGLASILAIVGAAFLFDRIYRVIDNPVIELAILAAVVIGFAYSVRKFIGKK